MNLNDFKPEKKNVLAEKKTSVKKGFDGKPVLMKMTKKQREELDASAKARGIRAATLIRSACVELGYIKEREMEIGEKTNKTKALHKFNELMEKDECDWNFEKKSTNMHDLADCIQGGYLKLCGCGTPENNLEYIMSGLHLINEQCKQLEKIVSYEDRYKFILDTEKKYLEHFGNEQSKYFFFYWADKEKLTEHGGCIPVCLTQRGIDLLNVLQVLKAFLTTK